MFYNLSIHAQPVFKRDQVEFDPLLTVILLIGDVRIEEPILITNTNQLRSTIPLDLIDSKSSYFVAWLLAAHNIPFYVFVLPREFTQSLTVYKIYHGTTLVASSLRELDEGLNIRLRYMNNTFHVVDYTNRKDITNKFQFNHRYLNTVENLHSLDNLPCVSETTTVSVNDVLQRLFSSLTTRINATFIVLPESCVYAEALNNWIDQLYTFYENDINSGFVAFGSEIYPDANVKKHLYSLRKLESDDHVTETVLFRYIPSLRNTQVRISYLYYALLLLNRLSLRTTTVNHAQFRYMLAADNRITQQIADTVLTDYLYTHYNKYYNEFVITGVNVAKKILSTYLLESLHTLNLDRVVIAIDKSITDINKYLSDTISEVIVGSISYDSQTSSILIPITLVFNIYNRVIRVKLVFERNSASRVSIYEVE